MRVPLLLALACTTCFDASLRDGFACARGDCPEGFVCCADDVCRRSCQDGEGEAEAESEAEAEAESEQERFPPGSVGAACAGPSACDSDECVTPEAGFPEGLCLGDECDPDEEGSCPEGQVCQRLQAGAQGRCWAGCDRDQDCREGYRCFESNDGDVCRPVSEADPGAPCAAASDCPGGVCVTWWPDGYCLPACSVREDCAAGGNCLQDANEASVGACAAACDPCREGYECWNVVPGGWCVPPPPIGESCDEEPTFLCAGGACLPEEQTGVPGGYCSRDCREQACPEGSACVPLSVKPEALRFCFRRCDGQADCREGTRCLPTLMQGNVCRPERE